MAKSDRTKARILAAAERLFAQRGIEGVSLREITAEAGLSNTSSVQYHFGGKQELLESLFMDRMLKMETRRAEMLDRARGKGLLGDVGTLMSIICLPHLDVTDAEGRYSYAQFLTQYLIRYRPPVGPLADPPEPPAPVHLYHVQKLIRERLAHLPEEVVVRRLVTGVLVFLTVLINNQSFARDGGDQQVLEVALADTLDQIIHAMEMPFKGETGRIAIPRKL
ncbi:regulatory protein TetR [Sphingobium chlorophenolicum L-1]|uniref:Regulatory protein TetR n=1 Tax=Sphingobium chlorophenolicum L-1 TaxID=690566 RepID=F6F2N3_SPHCR|nr:TetR/AcrR family transcriptional regulator [Sphingobium chlorophenolicum]AEG50695.1 regulatory protein TetR [Sphingobium chlorophenolicum L-1]